MLETTKRSDAPNAKYIYLYQYRFIRGGVVALQSQVVLHYPRLDTVLMVEDAIRRAGDYPSKAKLWRSLPKQVMYPTFQLILTYLAQSNKILIAKDGKIVWIAGNSKLDAAIARGKRVI